MIHTCCACSRLNDKSLVLLTIMRMSTKKIA
jgi:hypothetical protein